MASVVRRSASKFKRFVRNRIVFTVALIAAIVSMFFAPPLTNFLAFVDFKTIACLFCILASVGVLSNAGMMDAVARLFGRAFSTTRLAVCALVGTTMLLSMFITNDMALVVMLPLAAVVMHHEGWMRAMPFCFIMQNLAANLGGMILPFGNPQNLFLFGYFNMSFGQFLKAMAIPFGVSMALLLICCLTITPRYSRNAVNTTVERIAPETGERQKRKTAPTAENAVKKQLNKPMFFLGAALFVLTVCAVFKVVPYLVAFVVVIICLLAFDRPALKSVDWFLLGTFACFFIFAGNISSIPSIRELLASGMSASPLLVSAGTSQVISNVPAAVLLAPVTSNWQPLLVGVNIGGAGTIVASLASLITIDRYKTLRLIGGSATSKNLPSPKKFMIILMGYGFAFLAVLLVVCSLT